MPLQIIGVRVADAELIWQTVVHIDGHPEELPHLIAGTNTLLALTTNDSNNSADLFVVDAKTGELISQASMQPGEFGSLIYYSDSLMVYVDSMRRVHARNSQALTTDLWSTPRRVHSFRSPPSAPIDSILDNRFVAVEGGYLDIQTGEPVEVTGEAFDTTVYFTHGKPWDDSIMRVEEQGDGFRVQGFDLKTRSTTWSLPTNVKHPNELDKAGDRLVHTGDDQATCYDISGHEARKLWTFDIPNGSDTLFYEYGDKEHVILSYGGFGDEKVVIDTDTGRELARLPINDRFVDKGSKTMYFFATPEAGARQLVAFESVGSSVQKKWSSAPLAWVRGTVIDERIVLRDETNGRELLGIVGAKGADWELFEK